MGKSRVCGRNSGLRVAGEKQRAPGLRFRVQGLKLLRINVKRFRGGLVFKAHRLVYHSTLGWRVIKKKKRRLKPEVGLQLVPLVKPRSLVPFSRKVDVRLPGKGNSNSHGARPVHLIMMMMKWIQTSRLSIKNSLSLFRG